MIGSIFAAAGGTATTSTPPSTEVVAASLTWLGAELLSGGGIAKRAEPLTHIRSYAEVDSIDDATAKATELGGRVVVQKVPISPTSWYAAIEDTEGNQIGQYEGMTAGDQVVEDALDGEVGCEGMRELAHDVRRNLRRQA